LADEIKRNLLRPTPDSSLLTAENADDDERQGRLNYDDLGLSQDASGEPN
jgi:hypothetical protein